MSDEEAYEKYLEEYFRNITPEQWQKLKAHLLEMYENAILLQNLKNDKDQASISEEGGTDLNSGVL